MKRSIREKHNFLAMLVLSGILMFSFLDLKINAELNHKRKFQSPIRIASGPGGNLLVSDYKAKSVFVVDKNKNRIIKGIVIRGNPLGVAYYKGKIYVGNKTHEKIEVYTESGKKRFSFPRIVKKPNDIVIDRVSERLYVTDSIRKNVTVFNLDGEYQFVIRTNLVAPAGIAIDENKGILYVSDYGDRSNWKYPSIQAYDLDGTPVGSISGKLGMMGNRFSRPQGLAIDDNSNVFLVDCYSAEVLVFSGLSGILLKTIGGFGTGPGKMLLPYDVVLDGRTKDLFVTNNRAKRIEIFRNGGQL